MIGTLGQIAKDIRDQLGDSGFGIPVHDRKEFTYTGDNLTGVSYIVGGQGGAVVATQTLTYDGGNRIASIQTTVN